MGEDVLPLPPVTPLPEGNTGIAARYSGDAGIEKDPALLFHDDFSSGNLDKWDRCNDNLPPSCYRVVEYPKSMHEGKKALEFTVPQIAR